MKRIKIEFVPHHTQRYDTADDFGEDKDGLWFKISKMKNEDFEFAVLMHALTEFWLTRNRGIKEGDISKFDIRFERERKEGKHREEDEPGDDQRAPYFNEHQYATVIERMLISEMGYDLRKYDNAFKLMDYNPK